MNEHIRRRSLIPDTAIRTAIQPGSLHDAWEAEVYREEFELLITNIGEGIAFTFFCANCLTSDHRIAGHFRVSAVPFSCSSQFNPARLPSAFCCIVAKI